MLYFKTISLTCLWLQYHYVFSCFDIIFLFCFLFLSFYLLAIFWCISLCFFGNVTCPWSRLLFLFLFCYKLHTRIHKSWLFMAHGYEVCFSPTSPQFQLYSGAWWYSVNYITKGIIFRSWGEAHSLFIYFFKGMFWK